MSDKRPASTARPLGRLQRPNRGKASGAKQNPAAGAKDPIEDEALAAARAAAGTRGAEAGDSFIDEVTEELRRERLFRALRTYGPYAIAAAVALVVAAAVLEYRAATSEEAARFVGGALLAAEGGEGAPATKADAVLAAANADGPKLIAELRAAELRRQAGDEAEALALYREIAGRPALDPKYRDLAGVKAVMIDLETGEPAALLRALDPLVADGRPYRPLALELRASVLLRQGDRDAARQALADALDSPGAPQGVSSRAAALLQALGGRPAPAAAPAAPPVAPETE
ncbi:MAG: tetratricopeptide repeat protein [Pseudomonadota bacterium]